MKKKHRLKDWDDFYTEFKETMEKSLGQDLRSFYDARREEIYNETSMKFYLMKFYLLGQAELQMITEAIYKAQGKKFKRYYKRSYKPTFEQRMKNAIEEGENGH